MENTHELYNGVKIHNASGNPNCTEQIQLLKKILDSCSDLNDDCWVICCDFLSAIVFRFGRERLSTEMPLIEMYQLKDNVRLSIFNTDTANFDDYLVKSDNITEIARMISDVLK